MRFLACPQTSSTCVPSVAEEQQDEPTGSDEQGQAVHEQAVDIQIWYLPRSAGLTGPVDRLDRSGLYSPSRIRVFVKSPHIILLVKDTSSKP